MTNKKAQVDVERSRRVENQQLLAKYLSDTMEKEELIEWIVLNLEDDEIEAHLDIFLTTEEEAFESEDLAEPTEGIKISKKQAAYREINIPADWHQEWLAPLLGAMNEAFDSVNSLISEIDVVAGKLTEEDVRLTVDHQITNLSNVAEYFIHEITDGFNFLDVSPEHTGAEASKKTAQIQAEPGSVSHGTLREEDLIETFMFTLSQLDPAAYDAALEEYELFDTMEGQSKEEFDSWFLNEYLFDKLNEYSPPGHSFGAHPGDGSDFGWWPNEEEFEQEF